MITTKLVNNFEWFDVGSEVKVEGVNKHSYYVKVVKPVFIDNQEPNCMISQEQIWEAPKSVLSEQDQTLVELSAEEVA